MSKFTPSVRFVTEFEEDTVTMNLNRLKTDTFMSWSPFFENIDAGGSMPPFDAVRLVDHVRKELGQYVHNFDGLKDAEGKSVSLATMVAEAYFFELVQEIVGELIIISKLRKGEEDEGKSAGPQPGPTMESSSAQPTE